LVTIKETYSSPLINHIEPHIINGVEYTKVFTELTTNLEVGDYVYILNGNYDNYDLIEQNQYQKGSNGYEILSISDNSITIDVLYREEKPWSNDSFENYIKVFLVDSLEKFRYENVSNYYGQELLQGTKYNSDINNIFLCQIESMPYTDETETNGKFFKSTMNGNTVSYYTVDFDNNDIPLSNTKFSNGKIYVMEDFTYDGIEYKKDNIYVYNDSLKLWELDNASKMSFITKAHFKNGTFKGTFNDGLFGDLDTRTTWDNGIWRNGIFYNSVWSSGTMVSKSDTLVGTVEYLDLISGSVSTTKNNLNNNGYGFNYFIDSTFESGTINNGNFINSTIGITSSSSLLDTIYSGNTFSYATISVSNGLFKNNTFYSVDINNGQIEESELNYSKVSGGISLINTGSKDSIIENGVIENAGDIDIIGYDKWWNLIESSTEQEIYTIHKFFISEESYKKLNYNDWIILNNVEVNSIYPTNLLDNIFYMLSGTYSEGYYSDIYKNFEEIDGNLHKEEPFKVLIKKSSNEENKYKTEISYNGTKLEVSSTLNSTTNYSIDLIILDTVSLSSDTNTFIEKISTDYSVKLDIDNVLISTLQRKHHKQSWINGGEIINGSFINPFQIVNEYKNATNDITAINGATAISVDMGDPSNYSVWVDDILDTNLPITMRNLWSILSNTYGGGDFSLVYGGDFFTATYYGTTSIVFPQTLTPAISSYAPLNLNKIDGENNYLKISGGYFKNYTMGNLILESNVNIDNDFSFSNTRKLNLTNCDISHLDNITISNAFFSYGHISNIYTSDLINTTGLFYRQTLYGTKLTNSYITKSAFLEGELVNSAFINNKYVTNNDLLPINSENYSVSQDMVFPEWHNGVFTSGTFNESRWLSGTFSNGDMLNSEFLNGIFMNGDFGDPNTTIEKNIFRFGIWKNGNFNNGILGNNTDYVDELNSVYVSTNYTTNPFLPSTAIVWETGNFNNGILSNCDLYGNQFTTIWESGNFNNGEIIRNVIWLDGVFNNGKFNSTYGKEVNVLDKVPTLSNVINLKDHIGSTLSTLTKYNIASIRSDGDTDFDNPGTTLIVGNDIKFITVNDGPSYNSDIFSVTENSHGYAEKLASDFFGNTTSNFYLQLNDVDSAYNGKYNPLRHSNTLGTKAVLPDGTSYVCNGTSFVTESTFLAGTILGTSYTYSNTYAWRGGVFNGGEFGNPQNTNNNNPSWETGIFNGGNFYGKKWKSGTFIAGNFNGSGIEQLQTSNQNIYEGYEPQQTVEKYINDVSNYSIVTASASQVNYKNVYDNYNWFGLWLSGDVLSNIGDIERTENITQNLMKQYFNEDRYNRRRIKKTNFKNALWVDGTFNDVDSIFEESVFLSGTFSNGIFANSIFNPYVQRWDFELSNFQQAEFKFSKTAIWKNGTFNSGTFYFSDFENGVINKGSMVGARIRNGVVNYASMYASIFENGRFRNGNWYGSNFTVNNIYGDDSVPNPFEYLGEYFEGLSYSPFMTDILANNSIKLQDDALHIWNTFEGTTEFSDYDFTGNNFSTDTDSISGGGGGLSDPNYYEFDFSLSKTGGIASEGKVDFLLDIDKIGTANSPSNLVLFNLTSEDIVSSKLGQGIYEINLSTSNSSQAFVKPSQLPNLITRIYATRYDAVTNAILGTTILASGGGTTQFTVPEGQEYKLELNLSVYITSPVTSNIDWNLYFSLDKEQASGNVFYNEFNNTLGGILELNWTGDYMSSTVSTSTASYNYQNEIVGTSSLIYEQYSVSNITVTSSVYEVGGAYTQIGNGAFLEGIWENGVWNNGYRGTEFGTIVNTTGIVDIYTYSSGNTASVELNPLYTDALKFKYRTAPIIPFNDVQRSFKIRKDAWRFVLESAFDINATNKTDANKYNRLSVSDKVSVSNIVGIDINGNRKIINNLFTVVSIPTNNRIVLEYQETFPLDSIQIDSDRHLIYVTKNVWLSGAYLNGYFEGIFNSGYIRGNREVTKLKDSHLIDVRFKGGKLEGSKYTLSSIFDSKINSANTLSPQFNASYNDLYHSSLVQYMDFDADEDLRLYNMVSPVSVTVSGANGEKTISYSGTTESNPNSVKYIYNSDIDVVYEPEYFTTLYNQNIFNSHILNTTEINTGAKTNVYNVPAGYITYDILGSNSKFRYMLKPNSISNNDIQNFIVNLGSKFTKFNTLSDANFSNNPNNDTTIDIPSTFNIVYSGSYSIYIRDFNDSGIAFNDREQQFIHEDFIYNYNLSATGSLIVGDRSFNTRNRYHVVEADVEFIGDIFVSPFDTSEEAIINTTYSYTEDNLPKLTISNGYNYMYENTNSTGYLAPFDNDFIPYFDFRKQSEINNFATISTTKRYTMKSYVYNNFGSYRENVGVFEKGFDNSGNPTSSTYNIYSPIYYSIKHYELDQIPFYRYQDYVDPITGSISEWNVVNDGDCNQDETRSIDNRVKVPFYATSIEIDYSDDEFVLSDNINFLGGSNVDIKVVENDTLTLEEEGFEIDEIDGSGTGGLRSSISGGGPSGDGGEGLEL
jgi:hypothetical protein